MEDDNEDNNYYFEDPLNIGIYLSLVNTMNHNFMNELLVIICSTQLLCFTVSSRSDIPEAEFPDYVRLMHQDRDQKLELEFKVQYLVF